jgi:uncharacterized Zn finger protein (UPF0148 family)
MEERLCPYCGKPIGPDDTSCPFCQKELIAAIPSPTVEKKQDAQPTSIDNDVQTDSHQDISKENDAKPDSISASETTNATQSEDKSSEEKNKRGEIIKPLNGLEDILPIQPVIDTITKPNPYSIKVNITPSEQKNIQLLQELSKDSPPARPGRKSKIFIPKHILQILIGTILILTIIWPILFDKPSFPLPEANINSSAFSQYILSLQNNVPVLIAFDYNPGYSGELDAASLPILEQLMQRDVYLILLSTSPSGVIQAERVINKTSEMASIPYSSPANYVNLGYIPGGATGLNSLAAGIRTTFPQSINGEPAWQMQQLQNVHSVADFQLVIVVTESVETARAWIEQVRPLLRDTPLLMIVSSQVEPLITPYYEAVPRQVDGLIVGIAGGSSYGVFTGQSGGSNEIWSAFSLSILVAVALILIGSFINATISSSEQDDHDRGNG